MSPVGIVIGYSLTIFVGMWIGVIIQKRVERSNRKYLENLRKSQYTGQNCVECGNGTVHPASCDSCGASWPADMYLEGIPRLQKRDPG